MNFIDYIMDHTEVIIERPKAYGLFHILFMVISLGVMITVCYLLRNSSEKRFRTVMLITSGILIFGEIYKQLYYYYSVGVDGYDWDMFPFQLCSVPMYLSLIVGLMKKSKVRDIMCEYLVSIGFLGGIMAYLEPSGILHGDLFKLIHATIWHALLIFIALFILFNNQGCIKLKNYKKSILIFGFVVLTATILNLAFIEKARNGFNMCYISPFRNTPLAVFNSFDSFFEAHLGLYFGRIVSIHIYLFAVILGGFVIYLISYYLKKLLSKNKKMAASN